MQAVLDAYGRAPVLDLHTFPDVPLPCDLDQAPQRPDICIGTDAFHTPIGLRDRIVAPFTEAGFTVTFDRPYAGTMVPLRHLGRDGRVASIMIEVNRRMYLQPDGVTPKPVLESLVKEIRDRVRRGIAVWDRDGRRRG